MNVAKCRLTLKNFCSAFQKWHYEYRTNGWLNSLPALKVEALNCILKEAEMLEKILQTDEELNALDEATFGDILEVVEIIIESCNKFLEVDDCPVSNEEQACLLQIRDDSQSVFYMKDEIRHICEVPDLSNTNICATQGTIIPIPSHPSFTSITKTSTNAVDTASQGTTGGGDGNGRKNSGVGSAQEGLEERLELRGNQPDLSGEHDLTEERRTRKHISNQKLKVLVKTWIERTKSFFRQFTIYVKGTFFSCLTFIQICDFPGTSFLKL